MTLWWTSLNKSIQERLVLESHAFCIILHIIAVSLIESICPLMRLNKHMTVKEHAQHTIGVEFSSRTLKLGEKKIKLQVLLLWFKLTTN